MRINKGLIRDLAYIDQQFGSWRDGKNFIIENGNIKSEKGWTEYQTLDSVICGVTTLANIIILFSIQYDGDVYVASQIGYIEDDVYIAAVTLVDLNFNISYPILAEAKFNYLDEIIVAFTDNYNTPKIINITTIPNGMLTDISLANLFGSYKVPVFQLNSTTSANGILNSGIYYIGIQYALEDKSYSQTSRLSNPILIVEDNNSKAWNNFGSCTENTITNKAIIMTISNIDMLYTNARLAIVHKTDSTILAYVGGEYIISGNTLNIVISNINDYEVVDLSTIIVPNVEYSNVGAITSLNNVLYLANLTKDEDIKYQKYANNIQIDWVYTDEVSMDKVSGSHRDSVILFDKKSFMPDEIYALYIRFVKTNGTTVTKAFHIPGRAPIASDMVAGSSKALEIYSSAKAFHLDNTATCNDPTTDEYKMGKMGYWENANELYANDDEFNGLVDYDGFGITGVTDVTRFNLKRLNVRHHKFPSINYLLGLDTVNNSNAPIRYTGEQGLGYAPSEIEFSNPTIVTSTYWNYLSFTDMVSNLTSLTASFINNRIEIANDTANNMTDGLLLPSIKFLITPSGTNAKVNFHIDIHTENASGDIITSYIDSDQIYIWTSGSPYNINISTVVDNIVINTLEILVIDINIEQIEGYDTVMVTSTGTTLSFVDESSAVNAQNTTVGKILGIKVSNVNIPDYIREQCTHFEILYAKRNTTNMSIIGSGMLMGAAMDPSKERKNFYSYDILSRNLDIPLTHLSLDWDFINETVGSLGQFVNMTYSLGEDVKINKCPTASRLIPLTNSALVQYNQPNGELNNDHLSANTMVEYDNDDLYLYDNPSMNITDYPTAQPLHINHVSATPLIGNACSFKVNVYESMYNQELATTGKLVSITDNDNEIITSGNIYGGDVVHTLYGISMYNENSIVYAIAPIFNIGNSGLRYKDDTNILTTMFPDYNLIKDSDDIGLLDIISNSLSFSGEPDDSTEDTRWFKIKVLLTIENAVDLPELYYYNISDVSVNDLVLGLIFNYNNSFINRFSNRIHRSLVQSTESLTDSWKSFPVSNYYDSVNNKGEIYALETEGNDLLILHSSTLFVAAHKDVLNIGNDIAIALGQADIFTTKPIEIVPTENGYVGCQSRYALTKFIGGLVIVDRQQRKIFIYQNKKVEEISNYGMREFFLENLQYYDTDTAQIMTILYGDGNTVNFDDDTAAISSNAEITSEINSNVDNPFANKGIICGYDVRNNRLIFTKLHKELVYNDVTETYDSIDNSFSISYYPSLKAWGFRHTYEPQYYFASRLNAFAISNNIMYKMNTGVVGIYDTVTVNKSYIDVILSDNTKLDKFFQSIIWSSIVKNTDGLVQYNETFNSIIVYNDYRYCGETTLVKYNFGDEGNIRLTSGGWKFNNFRDLVKGKTLKIVDKNDIEELQLSNSDIDVTLWYEKSLFRSTYMVVRLIFDNVNGKNIELLDVDSNYKKVMR